MKNKIFSAIILYLSLHLLGCKNAILPPDSNEFYLVTRTDQHINNQVKYVEDEYQQIAEKRKQKSIGNDSNIKPTHLIGLGLSGGGIRSAAYQLGLNAIFRFRLAQ